MKIQSFTLVVAALMVGGACTTTVHDSSSSDRSAALSEEGAPLKFKALADSEVHKLLRLTGSLYSGAQPKTEQAFQALAKMGVRTLVNVDGATPSVELARKYGMEYVHVPIGYDKITPEQAAAFSRVMRERPGPIYFHCHHGVHRGPAAAAIALRESTHCSAEKSLEVLQVAGTSTNYPGLWRDVAAFKRLPDDAVLPELHEVAQVSDFEAAMAQLDRTWDEMKLIQKAGFQSSEAHPDLDPHNVARILAKSLSDSHELAPADLTQDELFARLMDESVEAGHDLLAAFESDDLEAAADPYNRVRRSCKQCHVEYRDD